MNIVITGCSQGIGYELVQQFSKEKTNKIVGISRNAKKLSQIQSLLGDEHFKGISFDLNQISANGEFLFNEIFNYLAHIDILINNAGYLVRKPINNTTIEEIEAIFATNLFSPVALINLVQPLLEKSDHAHVINIGSMSGFQGSVKFPGLAWYSASKAALACLTECLVVDFKEKNISFNCLALGAVRTEMLDQAFPGYKAPLKPSEMAEFIANFALTGHQYFNGKVIPVALSNPG
jgi:short-subunit dehydrogenase